MAPKYDVATILERETQVTIDNWYTHVEAELDLSTIPMSHGIDALTFRKCSLTW